MIYMKYGRLVFGHLLYRKFNCNFRPYFEAELKLVLFFSFSFDRDDGTGGIPKELQLFDIFSQEISSIISGRKEMPPEDIVSLQVNNKIFFTVNVQNRDVRNLENAEIGTL